MSGVENYNAFNGIKTGSDRWSPAGPAYTNGSWNSTQSNGTTVDVNGNTWTGEWLQIQLPNKIALKRHVIQTRSAALYRRPKKGVILASTNGTVWNLVDSWSDLISESEREVSVDSITHYDYFRLVSIELDTSVADAVRTDLQEWELFGIPEYDPEAHGVDVTVKSLPNVPNTDFLDVFVDAGNASGFTLSGSDVTGVTDLSTPANTVTVNGNVTYNSANKAFVFPGTGSSYMRATLVDGNGNYPLTLSVWFMMTDYSGSWRGIITVGTSGTGEQASIAYDPNQDQLYFGTYGADVYVPHTPELGKWYHVAATFTGGSTTSSTMNVYLNGVNMGGVPNGTQTPSFTNNQFVIGGAMNSNGTTVNNPFKGQVGNARFYRRAYSPDEIYQLYAYQKEYFGHGTLGMTLKAGRLGIGTSEPRAALDVRGVINAESFYGLNDATVAYKYFDSDTINHTFSNLNLKVGEAYKIVWSYHNQVNIANHNVHMFVNGDETDTNYWHAIQQVTSSFAAAGSTGNTARMFSTGGSSDHIWVYDLRLSHDRRPMMMGHGHFSTPTSAVSAGANQSWRLGTWYHNNQTNAITSLKFDQTSTGKFGAGSYIRILKTM
jgi:hypothetical protein